MLLRPNLVRWSLVAGLAFSLVSNALPNVPAQASADDPTPTAIATGTATPDPAAEPPTGEPGAATPSADAGLETPTPTAEAPLVLPPEPIEVTSAPEGTQVMAATLPTLSPEAASEASVPLRPQAFLAAPAAVSSATDGNPVATDSYLQIRPALAKTRPINSI